MIKVLMQDAQNNASVVPLISPDERCINMAWRASASMLPASALALPSTPRPTFTPASKAFLHMAHQYQITAIYKAVRTQSTRVSSGHVHGPPILEIPPYTRRCTKLTQDSLGHVYGPPILEIPPYTRQYAPNQLEIHLAMYMTHQCLKLPQ
jgi:hypothetical protein